MIDLDLHFLAILSFMYEGLFTSESICCPFEIASEKNTSQIFCQVGSNEQPPGNPCCYL